MFRAKLCPKCGKEPHEDSVRGLCKEHHEELMHQQVEEYLNIRATRLGQRDRQP